MSPDAFEVVEPRAGALVESLRAFGYSPETAIADLVDNSISADASDINVHFHWEGHDSWVAVLDNGHGMTEGSLRDAMRAGSASPLDSRSVRDLGRFGLGLKTASFSQCRRLVVISAAVPGVLASRTWDLDLIGSTGQWRLLADERPEDARIWQELHTTAKGTLVIWRQIDRIINPGGAAGQLLERHFYAVADRAAEHLRIIFHRFLRGPRRVSLRVNGKLLKPWDPFLEDSPATQQLGDESLGYRGESIGVRSFVLPHVSKLRAEDYRAGQGPRGWTAHQGFYVYRGRRLIVTGDWLGLGFARDEPTKLARIQLDLPNTMDQDWQLDVRKSVARPPAALASQLRRIAEVARRGSTQVYRHRGKVLERSAGGDVSYAWEQSVRGGNLAYRINRQHPVVDALLSRPADGPLIEALLRLIEETVPVPLIVLDHVSGESRLAAPFEGTASDDVRTVVHGLTKALRESGLSPPEIALRLSSMEPFCDYPELIAAVSNEETS